MPELKKNVRGLSRLCAGASAPVLLLALSMGGAQAQPSSAPAAAQSSDAIETVVVTAEKRAQNVQEVGLSITAFSGDQLENRGIASMTDLAAFVPNLSIVQSSTNRTSQVQIRGIGSSGNNPGIEPSVGIFMDGVYVPASGSIQQSLLDVATVEVLRGPQGTLYGRNTAVGAVNINTRKPTDAFEAMIQAGFGNYGQRKFAGYIGGGLIDDVAGRLSVWSENLDGYEKSTFLNTSINGTDQFGGRGRLLWTPTEKFSVDVIGYYSQLDRACCTPEQIDPTGIGGIATPGFLAAMQAAGHPFTNYNDRDHKIDEETIANDTTTSWGFSATANYELPWKDTVSLISAYNSFFDNAKQLAPDGLPIYVGMFTQALKRNNVSEELRIVSDTGRFLEYVGGLYYFHEDMLYNSRVILGEGANRAFPVAGGVVLNPGDTTNGYFSQKTDSYAIYGQAKANLTESLRLIGGLRYSSDSKRGWLRYDNTTSGTPIQTAIFNNSLFPPVSIPDFRRTDQNITWLASAQYDLAEGVMAYFTASTGYKDGGFNQATKSISASNEFDPENSFNYELGIKSSLFDNRVIFNADIYRMVLKDFQEATLDPRTGTGFVVGNAGSRQVQGVEVELQARPLPPLSITAALAYTDAKYTDYPNGQCPLYPGAFGPVPNPLLPGNCDFSGLTPAFNPKWRWSLTAQYERPLEIAPSINWFVAGDVAYSGSQYLDITLDPRALQRDYTLFGARIGLESEEGWRVMLWARNLTDKSYFVYATPQPLNGLISGGGTAGASGFGGWYGAPRTFGIEGTFRF